MSAVPPRAYEDPRAALRARLTPLLRALDAPLPRTRLIYIISGGPPGKRLEATLELNDRGELKHELLDELESSEREVVRAKATSEEARALLREVVRSGLLSEPSPTGFLPGSMVGSIVLQSAGAEFAYHFLADDRQRRQQGFPLAPSIKRLRPQLEALRSRTREQSARTFEPPT